MKKQTLPSSWYTPAVSLDEHGNVNTSWLDRDMAERYEAGQGILVPVASTDGRILSEKRQKAILKHYLTVKSHERFDLMVGVLRRDPEETVTQILRWCELFQRLTGKRRTREALRRIGVRAFAVCSPRNVTNPVVQRETFLEALDLGLPTVIYQVPHLSGATVDQDLIRELVNKYDNLLLVLTDEEAGAMERAEAPVEAETDKAVTEAAAEAETPVATEAVSDEATEDLAVEASAVAATTDEATEPLDETPALTADDFEPATSEKLEAPETAETSDKSDAPETAEPSDKSEAPERPAKPEKPAKRELTQEEKNKRLRRVIAAELVAAVLMTFLLFDTVQVQAAEKRSDAIAVASATKFMSNASPVVAQGKTVVNQEASDAVIHARIERLRETARNLEYIEEERDYDIEESETYKLVQGAYEWDGPVINPMIGTVTGPNGRETYYNLNMGGVVAIMRRMGNTDTYWVRSDGCKMLGNYVMVAADLNVHPRGSIVRSSRGLAIVCDTGTFARTNPQQLDIAVSW
ncbi:MAG: hypothetical protein IJH91_03105 [Mogibacterium sp.]|nr:hypothetical protein [Mogibacterium sp.]